MAKSAWDHIKLRSELSGKWFPWEDSVVAALAALIGYAVLDRPSAKENAIIALVVGLGAAIVWQGIRFVWRFLWTVPRQWEEKLDSLTPPFTMAEEDPKVYLRPLNDEFVSRGFMAFELLNNGQRVNPAEGITFHRIPSIPDVRFEYIDLLLEKDPKIVIPIIGDDMFPSHNILSELDNAWRQAWESEESKSEAMMKDAEFPFEIKIAYHDSKSREFAATTRFRYCPVEHQAALNGRNHRDILKIVPSDGPRIRRIA